MRITKGKPSNYNILEKMTFCISSIIVILFFGIISWVFVAYLRERSFYQALIAITVFFSILLVNILIFDGTRHKKLIFIVSGIFCTVFIISFIVKGILHVDVIAEPEPDLYSYDPFRESSQVASLEEPSALSLSSDLPIVDGATALLPVYSSFVRAVYNENEYNKNHKKDLLNCYGTSRAYRRLINGKADIIFAAAPSEKIIKEAEVEGITLDMVPIGREAFVFFVNHNNPIKELSTEDIKKIYSGMIANWSEVGGEDAEILAFQRPDESGSQTVMRSFMGSYRFMKPQTEEVLDAMGGMVDAVASYKNEKNAIGYSFLFYVSEMASNDKIRLLTVDGIFPSRENVANGTYPYSSEFYAVTAGSQNPNVAPFIEWMTSEQGQTLVEKTGYTKLIR